MEKTSKLRLDQLLVALALAPDAKTAQALILSGSVEVEGRRLDKPGTRLLPTAAVRVLDLAPPFASRAGSKLAPILDLFEVEVKGEVCMDLGASTGGFTDCLLQRGAARVHAFDVGRGLLDWSLRQDDRVVVREGVNVRFLEPAMVEEKPSLATVDLSFISLRLVLPRLKLFSPIRVLALVKPQFEAARGEVGRGGIVRDQRVRAKIIEGVRGFAEEAGFEVLGEAPSPLAGAKGNVEHFLWLRT